MRHHNGRYDREGRVDPGLAGCVAIVGGSSSGLGRATAAALAAEGCRVSLFARRADELESARASIEAAGGEALATVGDSSDAGALQRLVDATRERFGRIDVLVNNTGGPPAGAAGATDDAALQAAFELTLLSSIRLTRLCLPELRASGRGRVVTITASNVLEPSPGLALSNTMRAGVTAWAKTLAREEGPHGVTVNHVAPGYIDTDRLRYLYGEGPEADAARAADAETIPARRFGRPEEIAATVVFLASAGAAYISGTTILVDGGLAQGLLS
jgi:3-oxoacyl-[acyl-carrier protein] reductase